MSAPPAPSFNDPIDLPSLLPGVGATSSPAQTISGDFTLDGNDDGLSNAPPSLTSFPAPAPLPPPAPAPSPKQQQITNATEALKNLQLQQHRRERTATSTSSSSSPSSSSSSLSETPTDSNIDSENIPIRRLVQIEAKELPTIDGRCAPFAVVYRRVDDNIHNKSTNNTVINKDTNIMRSYEHTEENASSSDHLKSAISFKSSIHSRKSQSKETSPYKWEIIDITETLDSINPKWATIFTIDSKHGAAEPVLKIGIYNYKSTSSSSTAASLLSTTISSANLSINTFDMKNNKNMDLSKHNHVGEITFTLTQILLSSNNRLVIPVRNPSKPSSKCGQLIIRAEEQKGDLGETITFVFAAAGLRHGKRPFFRLSRKNRNDEEFGPIIRSEVHQHYSSRMEAIFKPITCSIARLANNDHDRKLCIEFFDYDRKGDHSRGGSVTFSIRSIKKEMANSAKGIAQLKLKKERRNGFIVDAGKLIIKKCELSIPFSFRNYLDAGVSINTIIAVDMSNTNGNPKSPSSLHYKSRSVPNDYVLALKEVGRVLSNYSTNKYIPAFGFGAVLPPNNRETSHCFALTGNFEQPYCVGIEDVINKYYDALNQVAPFEPCQYGPILEHVNQLTADANALSPNRIPVYTILLLVTDGDFVDFEDVSTLICSGADLPLSIVIVGVGNSDFVKLEKLDGDSERLKSPDGTPCSRDIVQFVKFHEHRYNLSQLAKEVLDEIPDQLVSYMRSKSIKPNDIQSMTGKKGERTEQRPRSVPSGGAGPYFPDEPWKSGENIAKVAPGGQTNVNGNNNISNDSNSNTNITLTPGNDNNNNNTQPYNPQHNNPSPPSSLHHIPLPAHIQMMPASSNPMGLPPVASTPQQRPLPHPMFTPQQQPAQQSQPTGHYQSNVMNTFVGGVNGMMQTPMNQPLVPPQIPPFHTPQQQQQPYATQTPYMQMMQPQHPSQMQVPSSMGMTQQMNPQLMYQQHQMQGHPQAGSSNLTSQWSYPHGPQRESST